MSIEAQLRQPLSPEADADTFRLGLVLSGTVSAGAWTAGVLDTLFEALDGWAAAKADPRADVPRHHVRIDVIGGASGGGVNAAIAARAATCRFPPARADGAGASANPFWRVWVERLDIAPMLGATDLGAADAVASSLLDGGAIDAAVGSLLAWRPGAVPGVAQLETPRAWLADPLRVLLTLTNLRGVPYRIRFQPGAGGAPRASFQVDHADHALFAVPAAAGRGRAALGLREDEWQVDPDFAVAVADWERLGQFAAATAAFPAGFPPRRLRRPTRDYDFRGIVLPAGGGAGTETRRLEPAWDALLPHSRPGHEYEFDCVDGGALNNQPINLVRAALNGLGRSLERDGGGARAAVLLIDPLAAAPDCPAPEARPDLLGVLGGLFGAWIDQARYATSDLLLALDPEVASRFLLTAGRPRADGETMWGGNALATAGFGAFLGFFDRRLRAHDFQLGRHNCREFLRRHFALPAGNPLFGGFGDRPAAAEYFAASERGEERRLPIIPIVTTHVDPTTAPHWPLAFAPPDELDERIEHRLEAVLRRLAAGHGMGGFGLHAGIELLTARLGNQLGAAVHAAANKTLT